MMKIREFFKNNRWIWIVIVILIAYFGDLYIQNVQKAAVTPTPTPVARIANFNSITPGVSSEADLNKVLGTPVKTTINGNLIADEYKSTSELRLHSAQVQNGKVVFIKEIVSAHDTSTAADITKIYGTAPNTLYGSSPNAVFNLYVYPSNGIAYLGATDGTLLEIWYFQPTTIEIFQTTWASNYSFQQPTQTVQ